MRIPVEEALRYLGAAGAGGETRRMAEEMSGLLEEKIAPRFLWRVFRAEREDGGIRLAEGGVLLTGELAERMLRESGEVILMACTLGAEFERMLAQWEKRDMARAAVLDACGSALVEAGCDAAEEEIRERFYGKYLTDRFSPGYGDLPLALQPEILRALDAERKMGVHANESRLLFPSKSVTAVIGLAGTPQGAKIRGCLYCVLKDSCEFRKTGKHC